MYSSVLDGGNDVGDGGGGGVSASGLDLVVIV